MRGYVAFVKKELLESVRTYKFFIMAVIFLAFGIMNPLVAKLTPELLATLMPEGLTVNLPEPSAMDSWIQFFKNISQMGMIILVVVFSGVLANELSRGTLINVVTKGLSRVAVISAKLTVMAAIWTVCVALCFGVTLGYTVFLFPGENVAHLPEAVVCLWLFGLFLLALLIFAATLSANNYGCLLITGGVVGAGLLISIHPEAYRFNPLSLAGSNMALIDGTLTLGAISGALILTIALIAGCVTGAILVFRRTLL